VSRTNPARICTPWFVWQTTRLSFTFELVAIISSTAFILQIHANGPWPIVAHNLTRDAFALNHFSGQPPNKFLLDKTRLAVFTMPDSHTR
jgi:hypothetical protein